MLDLGPVLALHGSSSDHWTLSALIVTSTDPGVLQTNDGQRVEAGELLSDGKRTAWRYRFIAQLGDQPRTITYTILGISNTIHLPAKGLSPRIAYGSCNGFSSLKDMKRIADKNAMWKAMTAKHNKQPYNVLFLGGDQVYADSLWETVHSMQEWSALGWDEANNAAFHDDMAEDLKKFYFDLYVSRWKQPEIANILAQVPMVAMWDDHDIIDGWGSYPEARQSCDVFQGLWPIARRAFSVFQQQLDADRDEHLSDALAPRFGFTRGLVLGRVGVLALDMRSERTESRILGQEHWDAAFDWMDKLSVENVEHLIVMSSIPVIYPGFDSIERVLGAVPGQQELEDDLRDHWNSRPHKGERLRLIHRLLRVADTNRIRPTLLSGDVHVGAVGAVESRRNSSGGAVDEVINQLISSGIVHPGPGGMVLFALRHLLDSTDEIDRGIIARMTKFPGTSTAFVGGRNYLSLEPDDQNRIWANWIVENEAHPFVKVLHPIETNIAVP